MAKTTYVGGVLAALLALAAAASPDQVIMSSGTHGSMHRMPSTLKTVKQNSRSFVLPHRGDKMSLRPQKELHAQSSSKASCRDSVEARFFTFDDYWPIDEFPNTTYTSDWDGYLSFNKFNIIWASEAIDAGFLDARDMNCAVSPPWALFNTPLNYTTPSVIRSNATALAEAGLSEYFDVIAWSWKPLGPYPRGLSYPWLEFDLYRVNDTSFEFVDGVGTIFPWPEDEDDSDEPKFFNPDTWVPSEWFVEPWGTAVNWIEIGTLFWDADEKKDEDDRSRTFNYCLDNLVLMFYEKE